MEEGWSLSTILIPLGALLAGWAMGFFDSNLRTSKKVKDAEEKAEHAIQKAERQMAQAAAKPPEVSDKPASIVDDPGLLRIKNESGNLTLDLDGTRVNPVALTGEQRKRLIEMLNVIRPWLEGKPAVFPSPAPSTPPQPKPSPAPTQTASPAPQPAIKAPRSLSKSNSDKDEPVAPPTSIVGQINLILQEQIKNTPLEARGLSMMESPSGGVSVYVGVNRYEGVDEVPDDEIKAVIRAAITEWEKKYTPGMPQ